MDSHDSYRSGQIARMFGVTTRALRHYDQLDLATPSKRTVGGARRYTSSDLGRLRLVIALAKLDIPLNDIRPILELVDRADEPADLTPDYRERLVAANADIRERAELLRRRMNAVDHLLDRLADQP